MAPLWLIAHEEILQTRFGKVLSILSKPARKRSQIEIAFNSQAEADELVKEFGGHAKKLPRDWLKHFSRAQNAKPLKVGKRLVVARCNLRSPERKVLIVPAGAAFGTGEHATTAMSLRLLEELTRGWKPGWSIVDLGTGSGILALAAKKFGAGYVVGIDTDPMAISTARSNARANKLHRINFRLCDAHSWKPPGRIDILTANLLSELLIGLLPTLKRATWLILSGILHEQERQIVRALQQHGIDIVKIRRRGKWIAILARKH